ncbi:MAG: dTDP-4-dehydrorhamnose reductase [Verrucomicrobiota bacterium]
MKIVIIGAGGRLGAALLREYRAKFGVIGFNRAQLDLANGKQIVDLIGPLEFDVLINAAALTNVDYCETHREEAFGINAEAPRVLAEICGRRNAKLIHFSTDYVFDGEKSEPYEEEDEARPISVYGESKREGERNVFAAGDRHLVVRVSWVFGPDRPSFVDAIINRALESENVDAIADKFATPTYTRDIAEMLPHFFTAGSGDNILHFANAGECSWQEYAQWALDCCHECGVPLKARKVAPLKLSEMKNFVARRPAYSVLSTAKYAALRGASPRAWRDAVVDYIKHLYFKK